MAKHLKYKDLISKFKKHAEDEVHMVASEVEEILSSLSYQHLPARGSHEGV